MSNDDYRDFESEDIDRLEYFAGQREAVRVMSKSHVLIIIADLLTDVPGDNPEYDKACVEIASGVLGVSDGEDDTRPAVYAMLRSLKAARCW